MIDQTVIGIQMLTIGPDLTQ